MLEDINSELDKLDIRLHFSEIKGPVMDRLQHSKLLRQLSGKIYLTHYQAIQDLIIKEAGHEIYGLPENRLRKYRISIEKIST
jgi:SulP family sulfate permease